MEKIQVLSLSKKYGETTVLDIPKLDIVKGEVVGVVGNNGAGKTTFFRLILDLIRSNGGQVEIDGVPVSNDENWKNFTGSYLDSNFLIDYLSVEEFLRVVYSSYGCPREEYEKRKATFSSLTSSEPDFYSKIIRNLSAGNRQKAGIIAAMIIQPELLILDEPFNYLDPSSQIELVRIIRAMNKETSMTALLSSHNLEHIVDVSSRVLLMNKGKIISDLRSDSDDVKGILQDYFEKNGAAKDEKDS